LQRRITDSGPLLEKSRKFVDVLLEQGRLGDGRGVLVNPIIQRWALSCMGISFMGVDLEVGYTSVKIPVLDILLICTPTSQTGPRTTKPTPRRTPNNHQKDPLQTLILQLPRP
jgi:hypothetical protein